jgi:hypothetical protein
VNLFDSGSKQNGKISTMINQLMTMFQQCLTESKVTKSLNQSYMFKLCLKKLIKKVCKLSIASQKPDEKCSVIFCAELISKRSI